MMGSKGGVTTLIQKEVHEAVVVTHCYGHSLQLAVCNTVILFMKLPTSF